MCHCLLPGSELCGHNLSFGGNSAGREYRHTSLTAKPTSMVVALLFMNLKELHYFGKYTGGGGHYFAAAAVKKLPKSFFSLVCFDNLLLKAFEFV